MSHGAARADAIRLALEQPDLSVGCHVVLIDGMPLLDPPSIDTLVVYHQHFRDSLPGFAAAAISRRIDPQHIEAEAIAQITSLQKSGIAVTHFDTHKHTHIFPSVLRPLLRAAKKCGIAALRNPFGPRLPFSLPAIRNRPNLWKRFLEVRLLRAFSSNFRESVRHAGMNAPDGTFGVISTGSLDLELFLAIIDYIPDGTWEFVCHPGYCDAELETVKTRLRQSRQQELTVLTSPAAVEALAKRDIQLISYRDLAAAG
jgi:predicted glycoside hydrolase/deacetylase ChbG (UPF0249 family)